jgi:CRP-like cAMP-binding protein
MGEGTSAEAGAVGNREMVGINAFMGGAETTQTKYVVQVEGDAIRVESKPLLDAFDRNKGVRDVFLKYTQAYVAQLSQNVVCNRLHNVDQRYARWLLCTRDRIESDNLKLTQEFISEMLGVRRATVTEAAKKFEDQGFVAIARGITRITNSGGLKRITCGCYDILNEEYDRLLGRRTSKAPLNRRSSRPKP